MEKEQGEIFKENQRLTQKILARYGSDQKSEIYLTRRGYQKAVGDGKCWGLLDDTQVGFLKKNNSFKIMEITQNPNNANVKLYKGIFDTSRAAEVYDVLNSLPSTPNNKLLEKIPHNKRVRKLVKIAGLLTSFEVIACLNLAKQIHSGLTKKGYEANHKHYNREIQNRLRTLKKYWKKENIQIKYVTIPLKGYQLLKA